MLIDAIIFTLIAVLSGMGVGGGGLLVIYLTLFQNVPQMASQGANLAFFIVSALASTIFNARRGAIVWKTILPIIITGILFSFLGVFLASKIQPHIIRKIFGFMLVISGSTSLFSLFSKKEQK